MRVFAATIAVAGSDAGAVPVADHPGDVDHRHRRRSSPAFVTGLRGPGRIHCQLGNRRLAHQQPRRPDRRNHQLASVGAVRPSGLFERHVHLDNRRDAGYLDGPWIAADNH
ncbi:hypothetical protein [Gordonia iterans]